MASSAEQAEQAITVLVKTSRGSDPFTFEKTTKVEEAITEIREHFELTGEGRFDLVRADGGDALTPEDRPLVSFGLEDETELVLTGGGKNV